MSRSDLSYLQKQRALEEERVKKAVEKARRDQGGVKTITDKFAAAESVYEEVLKEEVVGLSSLAEYATKRERVEEAFAIDGEVRPAAKRRRMEVPQDGQVGTGDEEKRKQLDRSKLSFIHEEEQDEDGEEEAPLIKRSLKDPSVNTSFLPDRDRDELARKERVLQKQLWLERQERLKAEDIKIDFHFYDGTTHSAHCMLKKGHTVRHVLEFAHRHFEELKKVGPEKLVLVKDNWILPSYLTFYELTENFSGPKRDRTFAFWDVDANAKSHFHIPKVMERKFFEKNSHIYPYSIWEEFDELKQTTVLAEKEKEEKKS